MTKITFLMACLAVNGTAATATAVARPKSGGAISIADGISPGNVAAAAVGLDYATGFEATDGFVVGHIGQGTQPAGCGGPANPCWGKTTATNASLAEGHIDSAHPAGGLQHLRLSYDPSTRTNQPSYGLGVDARVPRNSDVSPRPLAPSVVSADIAISATNGMSFRFQPQSISENSLTASILFRKDGFIQILDDSCGRTDVQWSFTDRTWDISGAYQNVSVTTNPCTGTISYTYAGTPIGHPCAGNQCVGGLLAGQVCQSDSDCGTEWCIFAGTRVEQLVVFGDNFPGSQMDIDNLVISSQDNCPSPVCGNGIREVPSEQCDGNDPLGCPGQCRAPGLPDECTCRPCTRAEPCVLQDGLNGPFLTPCDPAYGCMFTYNSRFDGPVSIATCGSTFDTQILYWGSATDPADLGASNDDCCNPLDAYCGMTFGQGSDPSAACFGMDNFGFFDACTCHQMPQPTDQFLAQVVRSGPSLPPPGERIFVTINEKVQCGIHSGSCCDESAAGNCCTDNVAPAECVGNGKVWTDQGSCSDGTCSCTPSVSVGQISLVSTFSPGGYEDIAVGPTGFETISGNVFVANRGVFQNLSDDSVQRIDPTTGTMSLFATVLGDTYRLAFGPGGSFGTDLYVSGNRDPLATDYGVISTIDSTGAVTSKGSPSMPPAHQYGAVGVAFSGGGPFGAYLYSGTSGGSAGDAITRIPIAPAAAGTPGAELFHNFGNINGSPTGLAFGPGANGFTTDLYVGVASNVPGAAVPSGIYKLDSAGSRTSVATETTSSLITAINDIEFSPPGSHFPSGLYVVDAGGSVLRVQANGTVEAIVTGLNAPSGIAFDGPTRLYVLDRGAGRLYSIQAPDVAIPAVSTWGTVTLMILIATAGSLLARHRKTG